MKKELIVEKRSIFVDEEVNIKVEGLEPREEIVIGAEMIDDLGRSWSSSERYIADNDGRLNLFESLVKDSLYKEGCIDSLLWSMELEDSDKSPIPFFFKNTVKAQGIKLELIIKGKVVDKKDIIMEFVDSEVEESNIDEEIIGKLFKSKKEKAKSAIIVLGGSTGGVLWSEQVAAILSRRGYTTLALNYFDRMNEELPNELSKIKLEYLEEAIKCLGDKVGIAEEEISLVGISKGAELALTFASLYKKKLKSVVAYVPSAHIYEGISFGKHKNKSSWTYKGKELGFLSYPSNMPFTQELKLGDIRKIHDKAIEDAKNLNEARIEVEKIEAPLMLISARKDYTWNSEGGSKIIFDKLKEEKKYRLKHICYEKMGHAFYLPNFPPIIDNPQVKRKEAFYANKEAWKEVLEFLK